MQYCWKYIFQFEYTSTALKSLDFPKKDQIRIDVVQLDLGLNFSNIIK